MRNSTPELTLETETLDLKNSMLPRLPPKPDLQNVTVTILGTAGTYETTACWQTLRNFWTDYLRRTGATITVYSPVASQ